jgi:hypothetical protein
MFFAGSGTVLATLPVEHPPTTAPPQGDTHLLFFPLFLLNKTHPVHCIDLHNHCSNMSGFAEYTSFWLQKMRYCRSLRRTMNICHMHHSLKVTQPWTFLPSHRSGWTPVMHHIAKEVEQ